jgi:hypothetical protein
MNDEVRVVRILNRLKSEGRLRDYALFGASAMTYWAEPVATVDLDFIVLVDSDQEFIPGVFTAVGNESDGVSGAGFIFGDTPVEIFPSNIHSIYREAVDNAVEKVLTLQDGSKLAVRVVKPEHLILFALEAWRPKDKLRVLALRNIADEDEVKRLIQKHDSAGKYARRYQSVRG